MFSSYKNMQDLIRLCNNPHDKEIVWIEDEEIYYIWQDNQWCEYDEFAKNLQVLDTGISFYDMNKQLISQLSPLSKEEIANKMSVIKDYVSNSMNTFYMLYGKEISYFSVFVHDTQNTETIEDIVIECLNNLGPIYSIELVNDDTAIEAWVQCENNPTCLYFFSYDQGIIPYGG